MRWLLVVVAMSGCKSDDGGPDCTVDSDCGGLVCARDGTCRAPSEVRHVTVTWKIDGMAADAQTCVPTPDLFVQFDGSSFDGSLGFAPVPCAQGQFNIDKLPTDYLQVEIGIDGRGVLDVAPINLMTNTADFDLVP
ncbi:MAG TPA: hypothetical protein VGO00_22725 [Kofleriaceae bacterium]|nr:hypothetical protein [Kofleriaceae bacterium]